MMNTRSWGASVNLWIGINLQGCYKQRGTMKIQKIVQVKNIGKFENYSAYADVTFADITIIYGENGKGKTTLRSIFRSLKSGNVALLTEKKRVGITQPIVINILLANNFFAQFN